MKLLLKAFLLIGSLLTILVIGLSLRSRVEVEIVNLGPTAMQNVSIDIRGASYFVGDIPAGTSQSVKVAPYTETSVSINHRDSSGKQRTLPIDTYLQSRDSGKITAQIKQGEITDVKQEINSLLIG